MNVAHHVVKAKEIQHPPTFTGTWTWIGLSALAQRTSGPAMSNKRWFTIVGEENGHIKKYLECDILCLKGWLVSWFLWAVWCGPHALPTLLPAEVKGAFSLPLIPAPRSLFLSRLYLIFLLYVYIFPFKLFHQKLKRCFSIDKANKNKLEPRYAGCFESKAKIIMSLEKDFALSQWLRKFMPVDNWATYHRAFWFPTSFNQGGNNRVRYDVLKGGGVGSGEKGRRFWKGSSSGITVATSALVLDVLNCTISNFYLYCNRQIFIVGWPTCGSQAMQRQLLCQGYLRWE